MTLKHQWLSSRNLQMSLAQPDSYARPDSLGSEVAQVIVDKRPIQLLSPD